MLTLPGSVRIYLSTTPTDLRKGHDGLRGLVERALGVDVYSGHLFGNRPTRHTYRRDGVARS